jgi:hypothetical protein
VKCCFVYAGDDGCDAEAVEGFGYCAAHTFKALHAQTPAPRPESAPYNAALRDLAGTVRRLEARVLELERRAASDEEGEP